MACFEEEVRKLRRSVRTVDLEIRISGFSGTHSIHQCIKRDFQHPFGINFLFFFWFQGVHSKTLLQKCFQPLQHSCNSSNRYHSKAQAAVFKTFQESCVPQCGVVGSATGPESSWHPPHAWKVEKKETLKMMSDSSLLTKKILQIFQSYIFGTWLWDVQAVAQSHWAWLWSFQSGRSKKEANAGSWLGRSPVYLSS